MQEGDSTNTDPERSSCDVLVVGGGPAGSTIATLLHQGGWKVVLVEQDRHPRFHIGESLLPMNLPIFEQLGVLPQVRDIGITKYGAEFNAPEPARSSQTFYFGHALDKSFPYAFQVKRSEFDELLFRNAASKGVTTYEGVRVKDIEFRPGRTHLVHATHETGEKTCWETRFVVDASGRDTFLARKMGAKRKDPKHQSAAIFGHFRGVERRAGQDAGNISVYWFEHGWFWMIPLRDDVMSVGAVCWPQYLKTREGSTEEFLWQTIERCPLVRERMQSAILVERVRATGNYSYCSDRMYGDGYILLGDAFAFVDPVFSTGVYLAMNSAKLGAKAVDVCLRDGRQADAAMASFDRQVRRGLHMMSWFIYRFTSPAMQALFLKPRNPFRVEEAVVSMLAGDVFRDTPVRWRLLLFKGLFYLNMVTRMPRVWRSHRLRRYNAGLRFPTDTMPSDEMATGA
jgi:flavin-dependent dehydrogenase